MREPLKWWEIPIAFVIMGAAFVGFLLTVCGLIVWGWPWWALVLTALLSVVGTVCWYGGVKDDPNG